VARTKAFSEFPECLNIESEFLPHAGQREPPFFLGVPLLSITRFSGLLFIFFASIGWAQTFGVSPGVTLVQNVKPGKKLDLAANGMPVVVQNLSGRPHLFSIKVLPLSESGMDVWEYGYEDLPAGWAEKLEQNLEFADRKQFSLFLTVPHGAENYNRRFMVGFLAAVPGVFADENFEMRINMRVCVRFMVETASLDTDAVKPGGLLAFVPGTAAARSVGPKEKTEARQTFWNNTNETRRFYLRRLWELYPPATNETEKEQRARTEKIKRYFGGSAEPILWQSWISGNESFELKAGDVREIKWKIVVPESAIPGKNYEEVVFLGDETLWTKKEIKNMSDFCRQITTLANDGKSEAMTRIWQALDGKARSAIEKLSIGANDDKEIDDLEQSLLKGMNRLLTNKKLVEKGLLKELVEEKGELGFLLRKDYKGLQDGELRRRNRLWMEEVLGEAVHSFKRFGAVDKLSLARIMVSVAEQ
jgi:hypothetical protein